MSPARRTCIPRGSRSGCASGCCGGARCCSRGAACAACGRCRRGSRCGRRSGSVRAPMAVFAINASSGVLPPLRNRLTVSSSHIVMTEPVPDVIEELGWTGGESISDGRALLHYLRTTRDGRILFGWAGGRMAAGARVGGKMEIDPGVVAQVHRGPRALLPAARGAQDRARLGRADRRVPHPPAGDRRLAGPAGLGGVRLHGQRRRARRTCSGARSPRWRSTGATR